MQQGPQPSSNEDIPGAVFLRTELPDPQAQLAGGVNPALSNAGLVVVDTEDERSAVRGEVN